MIRLPLTHVNTAIRSALQYANDHLGVDTITFNILGNLTISPDSPLPSISDAVIIDGNSQPGIVIDGSQAGVTTNGLQINADGSIIKGLTINNFEGNGIFVQSSNNTIKGNVISSNQQSGISITGNILTGNLIEDNKIGTDINGIQSFGNTLNGIFISDSSGNTIKNNLISANQDDGIDIRGANDNIIQGNKIGTDISGTQDLGNGERGINIEGSKNIIGGQNVATEGNTIAFNKGTNQQDGVVITSGIGNTILGNSIFQNEGLGIDLKKDNQDKGGLTLNDLEGGDADSGANNLQNYPELTPILNPDGTLKEIKVELNGELGKTYRIEFFADEGKTFLISKDVTTVAHKKTNIGIGTVIIDASSLSNKNKVVATATELAPDGKPLNTSEFSSLDTDGDGLYDIWETQGIDINNDNIIDYTLPGANPEHKDLYVEVDAMLGRSPAAGVLERVVNAFANAPVNNPDGMPGITLHAKLDDKDIPLQSWNFGGDNALVWDAFDNVKNQNDGYGFGTDDDRTKTDWDTIGKLAKQRAYRYAIFADTFGGSSGLGEIPGNDFIVTLGGSWTPEGGTPDEQAGTFMHELGHTLGLNHGGGDKDSYKPNYYSVMNYAWQYPYFVSPPSNPTPQQQAGYDVYMQYYVANWKLDYSRVAWPNLNENSLNEKNGINGASNILVPIYEKVPNPDNPKKFTVKVSMMVKTIGEADFNGKNGIENTSYAMDINGDGETTVLKGYNDWENLRYSLWGLPNFAQGAAFPNTDVDEITAEDVKRINKSLEDFIKTYNTNDDLPSITLTIASASILENGTNNLIYTFTRTGSTANALTVNYSIAGTADSFDYTGATRGTGKTITFAAGSATATLTIDPTADSTVESDETVALSLATGTGYTVGTTTTVTGTILNDDENVPTIPNIALAVGSSVMEDGLPNLIYTFTRTGGDFGNALTVNYTVGGTATFNTDYTASGANSISGTTGSITFAEGATTATLTIDPTADVVLELDETVALTLATGTGYTVGTTTTVTGTILNSPPNTAPTITSNSTANFAENGIGIVYTITATDVEGTTLTYALLNSDPDASLFNINSTTGAITFKTAPDFETPLNNGADNTYNLTVTASDGSLTGSKAIAITVTDLNEVPVNTPPTAVTLTNTITELTENSDTTGGIKVADIGITDDGQGTNLLSLNGTDKDSFEIRNNALFFIGASPDFESKTKYDVTVNVDDTSIGETPDASIAFTLNITNLPDQNISEIVPKFNKNTITDDQGSVTYDLISVTGEVKTQAEDTALNQTNALFHNLVGLYQVENANGAILDTFDLNGNGATDDLLNPNDFGYARTSIANAVNNFVLQLGSKGDATQNTSSSEFGDVLLQGGKLYAPFAIANGGDLIPTGGTLQDGINAFLSQNPNNTEANLSDFMTHAVAYFSFGSANPDGTEHLQNRGNNVFGFEDLPGNLGVSDFDFNDAVFKFTFLG